MIEDQHGELRILVCQGGVFVTVCSDVADVIGDDFKKEITLQAQEITSFQQLREMPFPWILGWIPQDNGNISVSPHCLRKGIDTLFINEVEMGNPNLIWTRWLW